MDSLAELLDILATTDPDSVREDGGDEHRIVWFLETWQEAGCPGIPRGTPVPDGHDGLCMVEVLPKWRSGRGRFYRAQGNGYTDDPAKAGLFTVEEARERVAHSERISMVLPEVANG